MLFAAACGGGAGVAEDDFATVSGAVVGGFPMAGPGLTPQGAVGLLCSTDPQHPACCTGTLVMNNSKVLTAAHCICAGGANWQFSLPSLTSIPAAELGLPAMCFSPSDTVNNPTRRSTSAMCWLGSAVKNPAFTCDDDMSDDSGSDLAVITLFAGVGATTTPTVPATFATPQPVYLGQNYQKFLGTSSGFFDGFGNFQEDDVCNDPSLPGTSEFIRRQMAVPFFHFEDDPCDQLVFEGACHTRPIWTFPEGLPHTGHGDSGGALFAPMPGTGTATVLGTLHGIRCHNPAVAGDPDVQIWAMTADPQIPNDDVHKSRLGQNRVWLAGELGVPQSFGPGQAIAGQAALYASEVIKINDRATIVPDDSSLSRAPVVAITNPTDPLIGFDSKIEIRNDVQTMDVIGGGAVELYDRVTINGNLSASQLNIIQGTQTIRGVTNADSVTMVLNVFPLIHLTSSTSNTPISLEPGTTFLAPPGSFGDVSVKSRATLFLTQGVYKFKSLTTEPGSTISFINPNAPTYIVINSSMIWHASATGTSATRANILWALGGDAFIAHPFAGTILAPQGTIDVDTDTTFPAVVGGILARRIEVHQGRQIRHRPFNNPWSPILQ
jgi:hypothetical protein